MVKNHLFLRPNIFLLHPHADTFSIPAGLTSHAVLFSNHSTSVLKLADSSLLLTYCDPEKESVRGDYESINIYNDLLKKSLQASQVS